MNEWMNTWILNGKMDGWMNVWVDDILIIHISSCISGSATCIEDIYNVAKAVEFGLQNIVNVRNQVALPLMHEE